MAEEGKYWHRVDTVEPYRDFIVKEGHCCKMRFGYLISSFVSFYLIVELVKDCSNIVLEFHLKYLCIMDIASDVKLKLLNATQAQSISRIECIQDLWGGYGQLFRAYLTGSVYPSVVVKHIKFPQPDHHPRGWNTSLSHQRKLKSYQVEVNWYQTYSHFTDRHSFVPNCLQVESSEEEVLLILEDLHQAGFPVVKKAADLVEIKACIHWIASFHALHMHRKPDGLWPVGTYWHLETRPDELAVLGDEKLKKAAPLIDQVLNQCQYQTLVHGDAKLANFCFSEEGNKVAAVDFQYIGQGCGMKDLILFISSCVSEQDSERLETELIDYYFDVLTFELQRHNKSVKPQAVEKEWRPLFAVAWADFHRFVKGWCPDHWKINGYTEGLAQQALQQLEAVERNEAD